MTTGIARLGPPDWCCWCWFWWQIWPPDGCCREVSPPKGDNCYGNYAGTSQNQREPQRATRNARFPIRDRADETPSRKPQFLLRQLSCATRHQHRTSRKTHHCDDRTIGLREVDVPSNAESYQ